MEIAVVRVDVPLLVPMIFGRRYRLERPLEVVWTVDGVEKVLTIPKEFITDGASIPQLFWSVIGSPYLPEFITAAIVHDYMCDLKWDVEEMSLLFFKLLNDSNVHGLKPQLMTDAVYLYKKHFSK